MQIDDAQPTNSLTERDKRVTRRKPTKRGVSVACRRGLSGLGRDILANVLDISETGICLEVNEEMIRGEMAEIELTGVGRSKPMKIPCEVRWVIDEDGEIFSVGLQFRKKIPYAELANFC